MSRGILKVNVRFLVLFSLKTTYVTAATVIDCGPSVVKEGKVYRNDGTEADHHRD
jgi:hypothetical protein